MLLGQIQAALDLEAYRRATLSLHTLRQLSGEETPVVQSRARLSLLYERLVRGRALQQAGVMQKRAKVCVSIVRDQSFPAPGLTNLCLFVVVVVVVVVGCVWHQPFFCARGTRSS
jgi:hypothetical protein